MRSLIGIALVFMAALPVMADDSSRRAIQNAFSLVYGFKLPSEIYSTYAFATLTSSGASSLRRSTARAAAVAVPCDASSHIFMSAKRCLSA